MSLFKLLKPGKIEKELKKTNIDSIIYDLEKNIDKLITLNPNIKIFIIGLFVPTKITYIRKSLKEFILNVNFIFKKISLRYDNVILINNDNLSKEDFNNIDFHPNKKGHTKIYNNFMEEYKKILWSEWYKDYVIELIMKGNWLYGIIRSFKWEWRTNGRYIR